MKIANVLLSALGFVMIIGSLSAMRGLGEITDGAERAGYITAVAAIFLLGWWLVLRPFLRRKKKD